MARRLGPSYSPGVGAYLVQQDFRGRRQRRENAEIRTNMPSIAAKARAGFLTQQALISQEHDALSPELQGWYALGQSGYLLFGPHPEQAVPQLQAAIQKAKATPGFSAPLLSALQVRLGAAYIKNNDPVHGEQAARAAISSIESSQGHESAALANPRLFLQGALLVEGKYKEATDVGNLNYKESASTFGPNNQLTLSILTARAQAEAALEDYDDAIRDELDLNRAARATPSGRYLQELTLADVAVDECREGRLRSGIEHAQQVIRESTGGETALPLFVSLSSFTLAECLMTQEESSGARLDAAVLNRVEGLLKSVDVPLLKQSAGSAGVVGFLEVEEARLALLRGQNAAAREHAEKAAPLLARPDADAYEKRVLARINAALARAQSPKP